MICDPLGLLKILGAFLLCSIIGWFLWKPPLVMPPQVKPPVPDKALTLYTYDLRGNEIVAFWYDAKRIKSDGTSEAMTISQQNTGSRCRLSQPVGTKAHITITVKDKHYEAKQEDDIVWRSKEEQDKWLKNDLRNRVKNLGANMKNWNRLIDERLVNRNEVGDFDYPVVILYNKSNSQKSH